MLYMECAVHENVEFSLADFGLSLTRGLPLSSAAILRSAELELPAKQRI